MKHEQKTNPYSYSYYLCDFELINLAEPLFSHLYIGDNICKDPRKVVGIIKCSPGTVPSPQQRLYSLQPL